MRLTTKGLGTGAVKAAAARTVAAAISCKRFIVRSQNNVILRRGELDTVPPMFEGALGTALLSALILLVLFKRLRRSIGRQKASLHRLVLRILIFGSLSALLVPLLSIKNGYFLGMGLLGVVLAWLAIRLTTFEREATGCYYTPNGIIGLTVFSLFVGRMVYRLVTLAPLLRSEGFEASPLLSLLDRQGGPPITVSILFLLVVFHVSYYVGVLIKTRAYAFPG